MVYQKPMDEGKWVVFKAIKFPFINFFCVGTIIMTIGFTLAIYQRIRQQRKSKKYSSKELIS
jgi:cytochrome c-type biogenesis protein CcmF